MMIHKWAFSMAIAMIATLTISSGLLHGYLDNRWEIGPDLQAIGGRLPAYPEQCGPWTSVSDQELDPSAQELLRCEGYLVRDYWKPETGERVSVAVLFGPRGPIAVHTPEVCYSSAGTEPIGERTAETVHTEGVEDQLWHIQFGRPNSPDPTLDVWYAWSDGGPWQASEHPDFGSLTTSTKFSSQGVPPQRAENSPVVIF